MGRREERRVGEVESDERAGSNKEEISLLSSLGGVGDGEGEGGRQDSVDVSLRKALSAGVEPNDSTPSCFVGGAGAGEEEIDAESAETSSLEIKVVTRKRSSVLSMDALLKLPIEAKGAHPNLLEIPRKTGGWQST